MVSKNLQNVSENLKKEMDELNQRILRGEINLLEYELVPIFHNLQKSLSIGNLDGHSKMYEEACQLLNLKFEELKKILNSLQSEQVFYEFLQQDPSDIQIYQLLKECWISSFHTNSVSIDFLQESTDKLCLERKSEHVPFISPEKINTDQEFILEVPSRNFNEKLEGYMAKIQSLLPCSFSKLFEHQKEQGKIFENFVYVLHLLQLGKLHYQKETHFIYQEEELNE